MIAFFVCNLKYFSIFELIYYTDVQVFQFRGEL